MSAARPSIFSVIDILVLDRLQRHADPGHGADLPRPLAGADARPSRRRWRPRFVVTAPTRPSCDLEAGDRARPRGSSRHACARPWRATGRCRRGSPGRRSAGSVAPTRSDDLHQRPHRLDLGGRKQMHVHAEALRRGGQPLVLDPAVLVAWRAAGSRSSSSRWRARSPRRAACRDRPNICSTWVIEADERSWPTRPAACQVEPEVSLPCSSSTHIRLVVARQMIGGRAADDAAADDDDLRMGGKRFAS